MNAATFALLDFANPQAPGGPRLRHAFGAPRRVLQATAASEVRGVLDAAHAEAISGAWCLGYVRYEAAAGFDAALQTHPADGPLAWFGVFDAPLPWPADSGDVASVNWYGTISRSDFDSCLRMLDEGIRAGDYYQVNYTAQLHGSLQSPTPTTALALFHALQRAQPGGYALYLNTGTEQVLSVSPELFFDWQGEYILTRPMKGTAPRGDTPAQDAANAQALKDSPKERAENVMIVDLLRNDLSRIAQPHSVQVPRLFHTEALPSVWQMTSDVTARTRAGLALSDAFAALFPCGSVTGAPKVQAMQAIRTLEPEARGVYCGALGVLQPGGHATFNVPIRTLTLRGAQVRCGIGSGITAGSTADAEWQEWQHKQAFVQRASTPFELLETLALAEGTCRNLDAHLQRMAQGAQHFGFAWNETAVRTALNALAQLHPSGIWRVRLLLNHRGKPRTQAFALPTTSPASPPTVRLQLADRPLAEAHSEFVRFKTTHRAHYDAFTPTQPEVFDTLLWNEAGEITECTRGNIALQIDGQWLTPPLGCGLLGGIGRALAIQEGRLTEAVVRVNDLPRVTALAFVNSIRGWIAAELVPPKGKQYAVN